MKKFIITTIATLCMSSAMAEIQTMKIFCDKTSTVVHTLIEKHGEQLMVVLESEDPDLEYALFINQETKTWTFIGSEKPKGIACVLGTGVGQTFPETRRRGKNV